MGVALLDEGQDVVDTVLIGELVGRQGAEHGVEAVGVAAVGVIAVSGLQQPRLTGQHQGESTGIRHPRRQ